MKNSRDKHHASKAKPSDFAGFIQLKSPVFHLKHLIFFCMADRGIRSRQGISFESAVCAYYRCRAFAHGERISFFGRSIAMNGFSCRLGLTVRAFLILCFVLMSTCLGAQVAMADGTANMVGSYTMTSSEGYGDFLKAAGASMMQRQLETAGTPTVDISQSSDTWTIQTTTVGKSWSVNFTLGQPADETLPSGDVAQATFSLEGNQLVEARTYKDGRTATITRDFSDPATMTETSTLGGVTAKRVFQKKS